MVCVGVRFISKESIVETMAVRPRPKERRRRQHEFADRPKEGGAGSPSLARMA